MPKILVLESFPAPYRVELFTNLSNCFSTDVFIERSTSETRNSEWLMKGNYILLETASGHNAYKNALSNLRDYDLVALYDYSSIEAVKLITRCRLLNVPYAINADGVMLTEHGNTLREAIKHFLIKGANGYFASGINAKNYFLKYGAKTENIWLYPFSALHDEDILKNPLTAEQKAAVRQELGLHDWSGIAIAVGRFIPLKRYDALIEAWKEMPASSLLLLVGEGDEEQKYRDLINAHHLTNVRIEKFQNKPDLMKYYQAADVFVHPTSYDVWGLVINEAMANGLPVIVSDHCIAGLELIHNHENGYLIPMGHEDQMCKYTSEVLEDDELRQQMSQNAIETIKPYTMDNMVQAQKEAIEGIIQHGKSNHKRG